MLSEPEIGEIKCAYRQAANPQKQIGVLADLYAISKAQVMELVGATQERPRAARKNEIARAKWDEQKTALLVNMVDEGRTLLFMAKVLDLTIAQVRSKLNQMGVRLRETGKEDALSTVCPDEPAAPSQMAQEMQAEVLRDLQTDRVAYLAFDLLVAEAAERTDLDMSYCWRAAIAELDKITDAWAEKLRKHPAAEASFAHIIALFVLDELLERGAANVRS